MLQICPKCGAQNLQNAKYCESCGTLLYGVGNAGGQQDRHTGGFFADRTAEFDAPDIRQNQIYGILSCFGILFFVPLVAAPRSKYARFCANQGVLLMLVNVLLSMVSYVMGLVLGFLSSIPVAGVLFGIVSACITFVLGMVPFALFLFLLISAIQKRARELPLIGHFTIFR